MENTFQLSSYDCIGFDMDHTLVQYHLPELFQLNYNSLANFLIERKGYDSHLLAEDFTKYEDFSLRGLIIEVAKGNFLKIDDKGFIVRACHGMTPLTNEEIKKEYGESMYWKSFPELKEKVFHGGSGIDTYRISENFFDMPGAVMSARIVDIIDQTHGRQPVYKFWPDVVEALIENYGSDSFRMSKGCFFPTIKANPDKYVKKCPKDVVSWLQKIKDSGKLTFLLTQSFADYTSFLMEYAIGPEWRNLFDFVLTNARKPEFFVKSQAEKPFLEITPQLTEGHEVTELQRHSCYSRGNAVTLEETIGKLLRKDNVKIVYFGDSPKSDVFPPSEYASWDTVAVLEEMEAEQVHFHRSKSQELLSDLPSKKPKITPLLKEEKLFIASQQWGSFFCHFGTTESNGESNSHVRRETFWTSMLRKCCKIAIPLLDYIAELDLDYPFPIFSSKTEGFYPGPPSTFYENLQSAAASAAW